MYIKSIALGMIFLAAAMMSACSNGECKSGSTLSSAMAALNLPKVEGSEVCKGLDKYVVFLHHNKQHFELWPEYVDKLQKDGWEKKPKYPSDKTEFIDHFAKGDKEILISSRKCPTPSIMERFGACALIGIENTK